MKKSKRLRQSPIDRRFPAPACSLLPLMAAGLIATSAQARPPVALPPANALPVPSSPATSGRSFVYSGAGSQTTNGNAMTVTQTTRTLGLNWDSFNVGGNASVNFVQPDAGSRVLNRIWDQNPSVIMGNLTANGQVYLINQNGILFGAGSQVNVGGLVASALNVSDDLLNKGLPANRGDSLRFGWEGGVTGFQNSFVAIDPGATIVTPSGSKVVLLAPNLVENKGTIRSGSGSETILAAGGSVLLTAPDDPNLRGLMVEVSSFTGRDDLGNTVTLNGTAANRSGAVIDGANGGVVTLAALTVNQEGSVKAGKAVNLNGQIMLVASAPETPLLTINQTGDTAQIDWTAGFAPVDAAHKVEFVQPSAASVAYNFVNDPSRAATGSGGRTTIDGSLTANGQLFLINGKGIDFGANADVQAASFVGSALGMNPDIVGSGLLGFADLVNPSNTSTLLVKRAFYLTKGQSVASDDADFAAKSAAAQAAFAQATVNVAQGAKIATTGENGYAMLFGSAVNQAGSITTPKGQALLAAGADVYLRSPYSTGMRGFTAEVNPLYVVRHWDSDKWGVVAHGSVTNSGSISAPLGDISLVGFNLVQAGTLSATTSVTSNGSIHLVARDQLQTDNSSQDSATGEFLLPVVSRHLDSGSIAAYDVKAEENVQDKDKLYFGAGKFGGQVTFGAGSVTQVSLDGNGGKTITASQTFIPSSIDVLGKGINVEGGAQLEAKGGNIRLSAQDFFDGTTAFAVDPVAPQATAAAGVGVFVGSGAKLDASGGIANKSVADLFVKVELRGDELANNPVQRYGALRGQTATVDIRDGVSIADISGWIRQVGQTVEERAATGGSISLASTGSVIVKQNATLDVSGGRVDYAAAEVTESRAVTRGGVSYRLNDAPSNLTYTGLAQQKHYEADYSEGRSAGTVSIAANRIAQGGNLVAKTTPGQFQRNLGNPAADRYSLPYGGQLVIRDAGQHFQPASGDIADQAAAYRQAQITFIGGRSTTADSLRAGDTAGPVLELSTSLADAGFSRFDIRSDGRIDVPAGVNLALGPGGSFTASGRQVYVGGTVTAPNGTISIDTARNFSNALSDAPYSTLIVDGGAVLSTAGRWINDFTARSDKDLAPLAVKGGSVTLSSAYDLDLRAGSRIDVSGGGRVTGAGKLSAGDAGGITLETGKIAFGLAAGDEKDASLFLDGTLSGYALGKGGSLTVSTSRVQFGRAFAADSRNWTRDQRLVAGQAGAAFAGDFLNRGGFLNFKFTGYDGVDVADGTVLSPKPESWLIAGAAYRNQQTGTPIASFAQTRRLNPELRNAATSLSLATGSIYRGNLRIGEGAYLGVDPQGSISLESKAQLTVLGTLEAPAGTISLARTATTDGDGLSYTKEWQSRSLYLGANSRLLAKGTTKLDASTRAYLESGQSADTLRARGLYRGQVLDGGYVKLDAGLGYLVTAPGSIIDVSGALDTLNVAHLAGRGVSYAPMVQGSAGGEVNFAARDGMFLDGGFHAAGAGDSPGGIFSLRFGDANNVQDSWGVTATPDGPVKNALMGPRVLTLAVGTGAQWPVGVDAGQDPAADPRAVLDPVQYNGKATLDLARLTSGGFGSWYLQSQNRIAFKGTINQAVANQIRLDSPAFDASAADSVALSGAAIQIGNYGSPAAQGAAASATPTSGTGTFSASARDLALVGNFTWSGFGVSTFSSRGDIHFDGMPNDLDRNGNPASIWDSVASKLVPNPVYDSASVFNGQLKGTGTVNFAAAQLYPSTFGQFMVDLSNDAASRINISRQGTAGPILSAAGRLEFKATDIEDHGTVAAPLGQILFTAPASGGTVNLWGDSVTTVAADSLIPLGTTILSGRKWVYGANQYTVTAPEKAIVVDGADTKIMTGAVLDLSGGGEAAAWEFTAGPGGKNDVLAASAGTSPTTFAVLPGWQGNFAPADSQAQLYYNVSRPRATGNGYAYDSVPSLKAGDQIQLVNNPLGLSGNFTLLPASYAHLPGAVLVTVKNPQAPSVVANPQAQADGSWLVAGTRLVANADGSYAVSQRGLTLELADQPTVLARSSYQKTTATGYFFDTAGAQAPGDAGRLSVAGRRSLSFDPVIYGRRDSVIVAADGRSRAGQGVEIDLAAPKLAVVDSGTAAPDGTWSSLDKDKLNALGASSLLLGGIRSVDGSDSSKTDIETIADSVLVKTSGDTALKGPELLLTAAKDLTVAGGSKLEATGDAPAGSFVLKGNSGDGAFMRVAGGGQATVQRSGTVFQNTGDLNVAADAGISGHSLILDATHSNAVARGTMHLVPTADGGGAVAIGADRINVVGDSSVPDKGLTVSNADLADFGNPDQIRLTSYSTIDLYGPATLGTSGLKELVLGADGIAGHGAAGTTATIQANSLRFENLNPDAAKTAFTAGGGGKLAVVAQTVTFGNNDNAVGRANAMRSAGKAGFAMRGFSDVTIAGPKDPATGNYTAAREVRFEGIGTTAVDAALTTNARRVVAATGSDHQLKVSGDASIRGGGDTGTNTELGGSLEIDARTLDVSGRIDAPAGQLILAATDRLTVGGTVTAEGVAKAFADTYAYAPAGQIVLRSAAGNVVVADGATVSVSGAADGGDAGTVSLIAQQGTVSAGAGTLRGTASSADGSARQAELKVDAGSVPLDQLADAVKQGSNSHFTGRWDIRARNGNLSLSQGKTVTARQVLMAADNGGVNIAGSIDASGTKGGSIELYSRNGNVTLAGTGSLLAKAGEVVDNTANMGTRGQGGTVTLGASGSGKVITNAGSQIDVGAADGSVARRGKVIFRAPTSATAPNFQLAGAVRGASDVSAEIVSSYSGTSLTAGTTNGQALGLTTIKTDLTNLYTAAKVSSLKTALGFVDTGTTSFHIRPGVEIATAGDFNVNLATGADLDFSGMRVQNEPGFLTLRAGGNLNINASISDGFGAVGTTYKAYSRDGKLANGGASWSYRLVAGADTAAANPLAVKPTSDAAGSLTVAAGKFVRTGTGDIALASQGNIALKSKAAIYTAGVADTTTVAAFASTLPGAAGDSSNNGYRNYYPTGGGNLSVAAGGSITEDAAGAISDWLVRYSTTYNNTQWYPRIASFLNGFAVLGGGDLRLTAGGDITNVTAVSPTNGRVPGVDNQARPDLAAVNGGGDLSVRAGGSVNGGTYYAETGSLRLEAGKSLASAGTTAYPTIGLGNTVARVVAHDGIGLATVFNPLAAVAEKDKGVRIAYRDSSGNLLQGLGWGNTDGLSTSIGTYTDETSIDMVAVAGPAVLGTSAGIAPSRVKVATMNEGNGDISVYNLAQVPGSRGQLDLLAAGNIKLLGNITQYDIPADQMPSMLHPAAMAVLPFSASVHSASLWHANDTEPSRLVALSGNITGNGDADTTARFDEAVEVMAGGNIGNGVSVVAQHSKSSDVTTIQAGGNIELPTSDKKGGSTAAIQVNGPGHLEILAGKDVNLGNGVGIVTRGNLENPYLPEGGASVSVLAGTTAPDYTGFVNYAAANDSGFAASLATFVDRYPSYRGGPRPADAGAALAQDEAALLRMPDSLKAPFLRQQFFALLRADGREALAGGGEAGYAKGRAAAAALFPQGSFGNGNIDLFYSQIKTEQGGDLDLLAPGGGITVGIANESKTYKKANASEQGLFTVRGGAISAYVWDNFLVNQSRVFTLDGGNILVWADQGNIDAGNGAKTVSATPPPVLVIRNGQIVLDISNAVSGSGIGVLASRDTTPASDMDLFAPKGAIDAGDAGLRSTGNVNLGAQVILNANNIQAAGAVSGAPVAAPAAPPAPPPSNPASTQQGGEGEMQKKLAGGSGQQGILTVEVLGTGEEGGAAPTGGEDSQKKDRKG